MSRSVSSAQTCDTNPPAHGGAGRRGSAPAKLETNPIEANEKPRLRAENAENVAKVPGAPDETNPMAHGGASAGALAEAIGALNDKQLEAVRLLARGHGTIRVARRLEVDRHTIARWKQDRRFVAALNQVHAKLMEQAMKLPRRAVAIPQGRMDVEPLRSFAGKMDG